MIAWEELVTLREAERRTGISIDTLREARDRGELRVFRLGERWQRVSWGMIEEWLSSRQVQPKNNDVQRRTSLV
jgi:hypothetical protein